MAHESPLGSVGGTTHPLWRRTRASGRRVARGARLARNRARATPPRITRLARPAPSADARRPPWSTQQRGGDPVAWQRRSAARNHLPLRRRRDTACRRSPARVATSSLDCAPGFDRGCGLSLRDGARSTRCVMHVWRSSDSDRCGTRCTWRVEHPGACRGAA